LLDHLDPLDQKEIKEIKEKQALLVYKAFKDHPVSMELEEKKVLMEPMVKRVKRVKQEKRENQDQTVQMELLEKTVNPELLDRKDQKVKLGLQVYLIHFLDPQELLEKMVRMAKTGLQVKRERLGLKDHLEMTGLLAKKATLVLKEKKGKLEKKEKQAMMDFQVLLAMYLDLLGLLVLLAGLEKTDLMVNLEKMVLQDPKVLLFFF
jgi:hypothetical protein